MFWAIENPRLVHGRSRHLLADIRLEGTPDRVEPRHVELMLLGLASSGKDLSLRRGAISIIELVGGSLTTLALGLRLGGRLRVLLHLRVLLRRRLGRRLVPLGHLRLLLLVRGFLHVPLLFAQLP